MTSPEIKHILRQAIKWCKKKGITGKHFVIDKYYVSFEFRPKQVKCKFCGAEMKDLNSPTNKKSKVRGK